MTLEQLLEPLGSGLSAFSLPALGLIFLGGIVASAVCPCTLPVGIGVAGLAGVSEASTRRGGLQISAAFFIGIVVSLTVLGALAGRLGALATESFGRNWALSMAILSFVAAVVAFRWPRMKIDQLTAWRRPGVIGAFAYGIVFSVGTSVAPLLLLLAIVTTDGRAEHGFLLAFIFGLGRGFPFLVAGVAGSALTGLTRLGSWSRAIQIVSGGALLVVSVYYVNVFMDLL